MTLASTIAVTRQTLALFLVVGLAAWPGRARGDCPVPAGAAPGLGAMATADRLRFLTAALERDAAASRAWGLAWGALYGVGTLGQLAPLTSLGPDDQKDFAVGVVSTAVGVAFTLLGMPAVIDDAPALAARGGSECERLAEAERLLVRDAANEEDGRSWYWHAANLAFNLGVGLVIGLGFGHWVSALVNFVVGAAIGEGTLFTLPGGLNDAWTKYLAGDIGAASAPAPGVASRPAPAGFGWAMRF